MSFWERLVTSYHQWQDAIVSSAGEPWTYAAAGVLTWLDGFFPPVPSESVVIALASLSSTHGGPVVLWWLVPVALVCAWCGDTTAYWLGRLVPLRWLFRGRRGRLVVRRAHRLIKQRGPEVLLTARFIPIYRVAVNMMAGMLRYSFARFALVDAISATVWALLATAIGVGAGAVFQRQPLLGIVVGIVAGFVVGWLVGRGFVWWEHRRRDGATG